MSERQWKQFVQLYAEKNQHLSKQQVLEMAKKPFQELQKHFSQRGGAKRHFKIHSITGEEIEVDIDTKLRVIDLKRLISEKSGLETDRQKLIHWTERWRDGEFKVLDNSEKLSTIPFDKDVETDLDLLLSSGMCRIESVDNVILYGTNASVEVPCRLWTFALENGEEFKVYRTDRRRFGFTNYLVQLKDGRNGYFQNIKDLLGYAGPDFGVTPRDGFVIDLSLQAQETMELQQGPARIASVQYVPVPVVLDVYCECGLIVDFAKMKAHLKTKKHQTGDEEGRQFMERAREYVSNWTP
jgi:hypothetical protein